MRLGVKIQIKSVAVRFLRTLKDVRQDLVDQVLRKNKTKQKTKPRQKRLKESYEDCSLAA